MKLYSNISYIYLLRDPISEKVRYVGQSNNPILRLSTHLQESKNPYTHKHCWINGLINYQIVPYIEILACSRLEKINALEKYYISIYNKEGFLTNKTEGGSGVEMHIEGKPHFEKNIDLELLKELYFTLSSGDLALKFGISRGTLSRKAKLLGLPPRFKRFNIPKGQLYKLYIEEKLSCDKIGEILNCSGAKIEKYLKVYQIPLRKIGDLYLKNAHKEREKLRRAREFEVFNKETKEKVGNWFNKTTCAEDLKLVKADRISAALHGKITSYCGYTFKYVEK